MNFLKYQMFLQIHFLNNKKHLNNFKKIFRLFKLIRSTKNKDKVSK